MSVGDDKVRKGRGRGGKEGEVRKGRRKGRR